MTEKQVVNGTTLKIIGMYRNDYSAGFYGRQMARKVGGSLNAVQTQLERLVSGNLLSSTMEGKNKVYRLNLSNVETKYYLVLAEAYAALSLVRGRYVVKKVSQVAQQQDGVVVLFGSFAVGQQTKESDIDLIVIGEAYDKEPLDVLGAQIGRKINVKSFTPSQFAVDLANNEPLVREVAAKHIILQGIDSFCTTMWRYYAKQ